MSFSPLTVTRSFLRKLSFVVVALALLGAGPLAAQPPVITGIGIPPTSAVPGTAITITGTGFDATPTNNLVYVGRAGATVTAANPNQLTVTVPDGVQYGPVSVLNTASGLTAHSQHFFLPVFTPNRGTALRAADFTPRIDSLLNVGTLFAMAAGALDNDGKPDLVVGAFGSNQINVFRNNTSTGGTLGFAAPQLYTIADYSFTAALAIGDIDGDGRLDLVGTGGNLAGAGRFVVLRNTGDLSTFSPSVFITGDSPGDVALADFDGDGKLDVAISISGMTVQVFLNTGDGSPGHVDFAAPVPFAIGSSPSGIAAADFDGDGKPDMLVSRGSSDEVRVFRNTSTSGTVAFAALQASDDIAVPQFPRDIIPGDLDGDGDLDAIVTSANAAGVFTILTNTSSLGVISFTTRDITVNSGQRHAALGDLNGDGKPDLLLPLNLDFDADVVETDYRAAVLTNLSSAQDDIAFSPALELDANSAFPVGGLIADLNGDGRPDMLVAHPTTSRISLYRNRLITTPTDQASNVQVTSATLMPTSATLTWTNGSGQRRVVFMKDGVTATEPAPADLTTYTANSVFKTGAAQLDASGWYAVYSGGGATQTATVTGLTQDTDYRVMVVEYNNNDVNGAEVYQTSTTPNDPRLNFRTPVPITLDSMTRGQASPTNAATRTYTVTFSGNVTGGMAAARFTPLSTTGTIAGASIVSVTGSGSTYTVTINTGTGSGNITLNFRNQTTIAPNITTPLPFAGETYVIDRTAPTLLPVTIASNNGNPAQAIPGNTVTLNFTASKPIDTPTVSIAGSTVTATNTAGDDWTATYTMTSGDTAGTVAFQIAFSDSVGNAGTAVTATTNASAVEFSIPVVVVPPPEPPPPPPGPPTVGGSQSSVDLTGPLTILPGVVINGGRLAGEITNRGVITGTITLAAGTTIDGGTVSGSIRGNPAFPATLVNVTVPANTRLENVTIGRGTVLSPDAVIGAGVRFDGSHLIPPGLNLTNALAPFSWSGGDELTVVDLGRDVLRFSARSILEALRQLPGQTADSELDQNADGELVLREQSSSGRLLPVRVKRAALGTTAGTYLDGDGNVVFVTDDGYEVLAYPVLLADASFSSAMASIQLAFDYDQRGTLLVTQAQAGSYYAGRAALVAVPAPSGAAPGLHVRTLDEPAGTPVYSLVFEDEDGTLLEQDLVPVPADWPQLRTTLAAFPGVSAVALDASGNLTVEINGQRVRGRTSYEVFTGASSGSSTTGLELVGDLNGDGTGDYRIRYPNGAVQSLFVYP